MGFRTSCSQILLLFGPPHVSALFFSDIESWHSSFPQTLLLFGPPRVFTCIFFILKVGILVSVSTSSPPPLLSYHKCALLNWFFYVIKPYKSPLNLLPFPHFLLNIVMLICSENYFFLHSYHIS